MFVEINLSPIRGNAPLLFGYMCTTKDPEVCRTDA